MNSMTRKLLIVVFALLMLFSAWKLIGMLKEYRAGQNSYVSLENYVSYDNSEPSIFRPEKPEITVEQEDEGENWPSVGFDKLLSVNDDFIGWIYMDIYRRNICQLSRCQRGG